MNDYTPPSRPCFITSPTGERLFIYGGPWSRPYVIPDLATEERLYKKVQLLSKLSLFLLLGLIAGTLIIGLAVALHARTSNAPAYEDVSRLGATSNETSTYKDPHQNTGIPMSLETAKLERDSLVFLAILAVPWGVAVSLGQRLLFRTELKHMRRLPTRIRLKDVYGPIARRSSYWVLILGLWTFGAPACLQTYQWAYKAWVQGAGLETFTYLTGPAALWCLVFAFGYQIYLKIFSQPPDSARRVRPQSTT